MASTDSRTEGDTRTAVLRELAAATLWLTVLVGGFAAVFVAWDVGSSSRFLLGVSSGFAAVAAITGWCITRFESVSITVPTALTLARGAALAVFAGFLSTGVPTGSLGWLPAILFGFAAGGDAVDGALARATDSVSDLGARLDTEMDGLTVLFGTAVVVWSGLVPAVFLVVGMARYAFVFGIWRRERHGLSVYDLPPSQLRRLLGGSAMVTIWIALLPVVPTAVSRPLAIAVAVPFIGNFTRDWFAVSGRR